MPHRLGVQWPSVSQILTYGYVNDTWAVETTVGRYVIKRRHPDLSEPRLVLGQHALMRHLCAMRFPVPRLIATRRGASFLGLDQDLYMEQFLAAYSEGVDLSSAEIHALPHLIRTIWLCASLDPPLRPRLSAKEAPQAVPEVLALADWAVAHTSQIVELSLGFVFAKRRSAGLDHLVGPR